MDAPQFDALSKALSGGDTRRRVLGALAAVPALGGLAALLSPDEAEAKKRRAKHRHAVDAEKKKKKKKKCKPPTTKCGKKCFNLQADSANCGGCGVACAAGTTCKSGTCTCSGANCGGCSASCNTCCNDVCCTQAGAICAEDTGACCVPESESQTCAGKCGGIFNNCGVKINCGDCACQPGSCPACQVCNGNPLQCNPDPGQQGDTCSPSQCQNSTFTPAGACNGAGTCVVGNTSSCAPYRCDGDVCGTSCSGGMQCTQNAFCNGSSHCEVRRQNGQACNADLECGSGRCVDGVCCNSACDGACEACNLAGTEGTCTTEPDGSSCDGGACSSGQCSACDVCANGCPHSTLQDAIDAANAGDTITLCPGTYGRPGSSSVAVITKSLTLEGAGRGDGGTFLDGGGSENPNPVVQIVDAVDVELRDLAVKGGNTIANQGRAGGILVARATATLRRVKVTGNTAFFGGGIALNDDQTHLALINTLVTQNTATGTGGGIYNDGGSLSVDGDSSVSDNTPNQCVYGSGGTGC